MLSWTEIEKRGPGGEKVFVLYCNVIKRYGWDKWQRPPRLTLCFALLCFAPINQSIGKFDRAYGGVVLL